LGETERTCDTSNLSKDVHLVTVAFSFVPGARLMRSETVHFGLLLRREAISVAVRCRVHRCREALVVAGGSSWRSGARLILFVIEISPFGTVVDVLVAGDETALFAGGLGVCGAKAAVAFRTGRFL
jgi:hypothetical protein